VSVYTMLADDGHCLRGRLGAALYIAVHCLYQCYSNYGLRPGHRPRRFGYLAADWHLNCIQYNTWVWYNFYI